jgi:chromosome partitioning protein
MRTVALMNQKGGVGKTTCAVNLGAAMAALGQRVLLIDMDPQANLGLHLDLDIHELEHSTYSVLAGRSSVRDAVVRDVRPNVAVLPANIDLSGAEVELMSAVGRETLLRDRLRAYLREEPHDFVLVDCPPSLGLLSLNALTAVREVFIPLQTEFFALQGMTRLLDVVALIKERLNPDLEVTAIIATLFDARTNLSREVVEEIRRYFGPKVCETVVRANVRLAEAPSHGQTIFDYAPDSHGAEDFERLAREILSRGESAGEGVERAGEAIPS